MTYEEDEKLGSWMCEEDLVRKALKEHKSPAEIEEMMFDNHDLFEDEKYWVGEWLIRHGGSFARGVGVALCHADQCNSRKIHDTWPRLWKDALKHTEKRRKVKNYY